MLYQALYPVETLERCVYALYISEKDRMNNHCLVDSKVRHVNFAVSFGVYFWTVSSLATEKIQIRSLTDTN